MGSLQADSEEKQEMDDSGCIQDDTPQDTKSNGYYQQVQLLDLSDDVLLLIFKHVSPRDLKALGFTCPRLGALVLDRSLWQMVDARDQPWGSVRLRWYLAHALYAGTKELLLAGYARETRSPETRVGARACEPRSACPGAAYTITPRALRHIAHKCCHLTSLALDYCNIDCTITSISHFPRTIKKLSLRGSKCYDWPLDRSFLFKIQDYLPELESLDVCKCDWMEPASLLPLSKLPALRRLYMRDCHRLTEFVAYASLATRYGFTKLQTLDLRGSPVGDSEVSALGWLAALTSLQLAPARPAAPPARAELPPHQDDWEHEIPEYYKFKLCEDFYEDLKEDHIEFGDQKWSFDRSQLDEPTYSGTGIYFKTGPAAPPSDDKAPKRKTSPTEDPGPSKRVKDESTSKDSQNQPENDENEDSSQNEAKNDEKEENSQNEAKNNENEEYSQNDAKNNVNEENAQNNAKIDVNEAEKESSQNEAKNSESEAVNEENSQNNANNVNEGASTSRNETEEPRREAPPEREAEPRHHVLYVNVGQQLHAVYRLSLDNEHIFSLQRHQNQSAQPRVFLSHLPLHLDSRSLVTDAAVRRFGRADGEDINYVHIGPNGPYVADILPGARPNRSSLRHLSITGFRHITDRSLVHLATAAPDLQFVDFSETNVTAAGVEKFKSIRPDCEVIFSPYVEKEE